MTAAPYTDRFWDALSDGRFLLHECSACGHVFFPPMPACPDCHDRDVDWLQSDARGDLYAFTRQHRTAAGFDSPIVLGTVELDEGPRLLARLEADYETLTIGDRIELRPVEYDGGADRRRLDDHPFFRGYLL
ncbi:MAG: Zn-ribbon domain-containing OB-fold protein [Salinirussus sp.]